MSKKEMGIVKLEHLRGLTVERMMMMMMEEEEEMMMMVVMMVMKHLYVQIVSKLVTRLFMPFRMPVIVFWR